jgi:hypothetical protein
MKVFLGNRPVGLDQNSVTDEINTAKNSEKQTDLLNKKMLFMQAHN